MTIAPNKIIISRTDNIGDVVLTLPMAGLLKKQYPNCEIIFLARNYVKDVVTHCTAVDTFLDWEALRDLPVSEIAKQFQADTIIHVFPNKKIAKAAKIAKIKHRIGSNRRSYHWLTCNHFINISRQKSSLHEAQLNLKLLKPFNCHQILSLQELTKLVQLNLPAIPAQVKSVIDPDKYSLIIHPGTNGHTREWSEHNFKELINSLPKDRIQILITGTEKERQFFQASILDQVNHINNVMGQFSLLEFMQLIAHSDALLAGSTGPVHLAGILGKNTIGLYPPCQGMNPQRWAPLGEKTHCVVGRPQCDSCDTSIKAPCMAGITVNNIKQLICRFANA